MAPSKVTAIWLQVPGEAALAVTTEKPSTDISIGDFSLRAEGRDVVCRFCKVKNIWKKKFFSWYNFYSFR